jgi:hypothetical protein
LKPPRHFDRQELPSQTRMVTLEGEDVEDEDDDDDDKATDSLHCVFKVISDNKNTVVDLKYIIMIRILAVCMCF